MRPGAAPRYGTLGALLLALVLIAGPAPASANAGAATDTVDVHVRVWQDVSDPLRLFISARPAGGRWDTLGTIRLLLDDGLSSSRDDRFGDVTVDGVEVRVSQDVHEPLRIHVGARVTGGDRDALGEIRLLLDDGHSPGGHYRYGDITLRVPVPDPGPAVTASPGGEDVPRLAAVTIAFRDPPPRADGGSLVSIDPPIEGSFAWLDGRTLLFQPDFPGWQRGQAYRVVVDAGAAGLGADHVHAFTAEGRLEVSYVIPGDGDEEVPASARILVQFSRSVAPLTVLQEGPAPAVLAFDPPLAGRGEWLNTSLYRFTPTDLRPHTEYTVRVPSGLTSASDGVLDSDYSWSFTTIQPAVAGFEPQDGAIHVEPDAHVVVTFNQPMDHSSVEAGLSLSEASGEAPKEPIANSFAWSEDSTVVTLVPDDPLALGTDYEVVARGGLSGADGGATLAERSSGFRTVHPPRITGTSPQDGEENAYCCTIRISYNNPMDRESFPGRILVNGSPVEERSLGRSDSAVRIYGAVQPGGHYTVRLEAGVRDRGGRVLPAYEFSFTTRPPRVALRLQAGDAVAIFPSGDEQILDYLATSAEEVQFLLHRLSDEEADALLRRGFIDDDFEPGSVPIREWTEAIDDEDGGTPRVRATSLGGGEPLAEDHYLLSATALGPIRDDWDPENLPPSLRGAIPDPTWGRDSSRRELVLSVVDTTIVTKLAHDELLVWALDYESGEPLAHVEVRAVSAGDPPYSTAESEVTDEDGLARFAIPPERGHYWSPYGDYLVRIDGGGRTGVALTWWESGSRPYRLGVPVSGYFAGPLGHLYTERPIYRPGETVFYKGVVREDDDASYSVPDPGSELTVQIRDPRYRWLPETSAPVNALGAFVGELPLPANAPTGRYAIWLRDGGGRHVTSTSFTVAEFRAPEFEVDVEAASASYIAGETIAIEAEARFFFGGPVVDADVTWAAHSSPTFFRAEAYEGYSFSEYRRSDVDPRRARGSAKTDEAGSAEIDVPSVLETGEGTQLFTISTTVTDQSAQAVAGSTTVTVHPAAWYAGIRTDSYVATAGEPVTVRLVTVDTAGRAAPDRPVTVRIVEREWITTLEKTEGGDYRYRSELRETDIETLSVTTGEDGETSTAFTPPSAGSYLLVAESTDEQGRVARSARSLWVSGSGHARWFVRDDNRIELVADRESYEVGDVARVLVPAPFAGATGLVTVERGRVLDTEVRTFETNSEVLLIPIEQSHLPNVYVGVVLYRPPTEEDPLPRYRIGYVNLPVATDPVALDVRVEPDRDQAIPGETVRYDVHVTDSEGRGVAAEVSVAIVDEAVLSLAAEVGPDGLTAFWSERSLGVRTAWSRAPAERQGGGDSDMAVAEPAAAPAAARAESAAPGDDAARIRSDFRYTALWLGQLTTDADGRASFELELPDNATTWRAMARAVTTETQVGQGASELLVTQPLLVRPALPRFLRVGDQVSLRTLVRNGTQEARDLVVTIEAEGVVLDADAAQSATVESGNSALFSWPARALSEGTATIRFRATATGGYGDAVELSLPVHLDVTPETTATGGVVDDSPVIEALFLPDYVITGQGSLEISLQGSLVGALDEELPAFAPYTWESNERIASRIVATVAVSRASPNGLTEEHESQLRADIESLAGAQNYDGGWAWCRECSGTNIWVTGWVLLALEEARGAGYAVPEHEYSRSMDLITRHLSRETDVERPADPNQHAFLLYALASAANEGGAVSDLAREQSALAHTLVTEQRAQLASWGRAYALLALLASGHDPADGAVRALLNDLSASTVASANGNHWEDPHVPGSMHNTSVRATALVLRALTEAAPRHPLIEETVRWLVLARSERRWKTSVERAQGMASLGAFAELTGETRGVYDYQVLLNTRRVLDGDFDVPAGDRSDGIALPLEQLPAGEVSLVQIGRGTGQEGRLYYALNLRYVTPAKEIGALNRGFAVSRRYSLLGDPETPVTGASPGDIVRVTVTVVAPADRLFARVEDFLPAGLEPVDPGLDIVPEWLRDQLRREQAEARQRNAPSYVAPWYGWYYNPWDQVNLRDDRLVLFASRLPEGVHEYVYYARATTPGDFFVAPARGEETYLPEVFGRSDSGRFAVAETGPGSAP